MKRTLLVCLFLATSFTQVTHAEGQDEICLSVARLYFPSSEAVNAIVDSPVPDELREIYQNRYFCDGWVQLEQSLLTTNLKYGDEDTTASALTFIESQVLRKSPSNRGVKRRAKKRAKLQLKVQKILADLRQATESEARQTLSREYAELLAEIAATMPTPYGAVAGYYLEAAEFYLSAAFLEKASGHTDDQERQLDVYNQAATEQSVSNDEELQQLNLALHHLKERIAVSRAVTDRSPDSIESAHDLMISRFNKAYEQVADVFHFGIPESICDLDEKRLRLTEGDLRDIEGDQFFPEECEDEVWEHTIRIYWYRMSVLEMLMGADVKNFRRMTNEEISAFGVASNGIKRPNIITRRLSTAEPPTEDELRWPFPVKAMDNYLAMAKFFRIEDPTQLGVFGNPLHDTAWLFWVKTQIETEASYRSQLALEGLRWVQPYEHPALWRRLAETYLDNVDLSQLGARDRTRHKYILDNL